MRQVCELSALNLHEDDVHPMYRRMWRAWRKRGGPLVVVRYRGHTEVVQGYDPRNPDPKRWLATPFGVEHIVGEVAVAMWADHATAT